MAAKKRCQFQINTDAQCNSAALRFVGECPHCRAQFCGSVGSSPISRPVFWMANDPFASIDYPSTTTVASWKTADNRHSTGIRVNWRVSGRWLPRWPLHSVRLLLSYCMADGQPPNSTHHVHISMNYLCLYHRFFLFPGC